MLIALAMQHSLDKSDIYISNPRMPDLDKGIYERRGYKVLVPKDVPGDRTEQYVTPTTFVFSTEEYLENIAGLVGHSGIHPPIYLGLSPRFLLQDTLKRPEYVPENDCLLPNILTTFRLYSKNNGIPKVAQKILRDGFFWPFVRNRPYHDLVDDLEYKGMRPHMAVFWNPERAPGVDTGQVKEGESGTSGAGPSGPINQASPARKIIKVKRPPEGDKDSAT